MQTMKFGIKDFYSLVTKILLKNYLNFPTKKNTENNISEKAILNAT